MARLKLDIVTAERSVFSEEVDMVIAPGSEGQLGILPHHAALLTTLQPGELRIKQGGGEIALAISGGFLEVQSNHVVVLADTAERAEEIDMARAEEARRRAEERLRARPADVDRARAEAALRRSLIRLRLARRRKEKPT